MTHLAEAFLSGFLSLAFLEVACVKLLVGYAKKHPEWIFRKLANGMRGAQSLMTSKISKED